MHHHQGHASLQAIRVRGERVMWVELSCGHSCWVSWLEAFVGRIVSCPGDGWRSGRCLCIGTAQTITTVYGQLEVVA